MSPPDQITALADPEKHGEAHVTEKAQNDEGVPHQYTQRGLKQRHLSMLSFGGAIGELCSMVESG